MEICFKERLRTSGQLKFIEKRTGQLWFLATTIIFLLGAALVAMDISETASRFNDQVLGINREFFRVAIIACILLICAYFWEKVRELKQITVYLVSELQHYAASLERRNEELHTLNTLSEQLVGSIEMDGGLLKVLDTTLKAIHASSGEILLVDSETDEFIVKAVKNSVEEKQLGQRFPVKKDIRAWIAKRGEPIILNHTLPDLKAAQPRKQHQETHAFIGVPLRVAGESVGVMSISNRSSEREFTQSDLEVLTAFAGQAATVIERTQAYCQLRDHISKLEKALKVCDESKPSPIAEALGKFERLVFNSIRR